MTSGMGPGMGIDSLKDYMVFTENLNKSYKNIKAVKDVNIKVKPGEIFGLVGADGAGKTTTIQNTDPSEKKKDNREKSSVRKLTWKEKKELETIEKNILDAEAEVERIEAIFSSPDFFEKYAEQTNELNKKLEETKIKVQTLYDRWEELEEIKSLS